MRVRRYKYKLFIEVNRYLHDESPEQRLISASIIISAISRRVDLSTFSQPLAWPTYTFRFSNCFMLCRCLELGNKDYQLALYSISNLHHFPSPNYNSGVAKPLLSGALVNNADATTLVNGKLKSRETKMMRES